MSRRVSSSQTRKAAGGESLALFGFCFVLFFFFNFYLGCQLKEMIFLHTEGVLLNCKRRGEQSTNDSLVSLGFFQVSFEICSQAHRTYATDNKKTTYNLQYKEEKMQF